MNPLKVMEQCARLALLGKGKVKTNPIVGAMIIKNNKIIGQGYHEEFGGPHAEIVALESAVEDVKGADLYVTLEPCSHQGKTPPCTDAIIKAGIKRVFIGVVDPNPVNAGNGMKILEKNGIEVFLGYCENICASLIEDFTKTVLKKQPYFSLKTAQTIDGKIATSNGDSKWITSVSSREYVHYLRSISDAILVGISTVLQDNPNLNVRFLDTGREPFKVVLDSKLKMPKDAVLVEKFAKNLILFKDKNYSDAEKENYFNEKGVQIISVNTVQDGLLDLNEVANELYNLNIMNVLVEGGGKVFGSFIDDSLADNVYSFISPRLFGGGINVTEGKGPEKVKDGLVLKNCDVKRFENDILISGKINDYTNHVLELTERLRNRCSRVL